METLATTFSDGGARFYVEKSASRLERYPHSKLCGKRNSDRRPWTKEIPQPAGWNRQLLQVLDWRCVRTGRVRADVGHISRQSFRRRNIRQGGHICNEIGAGIIPVEDIKELRKRTNLQSVPELDRTAHSQIHLDIRRAPKRVQRSLDSIHRHARAVIGSRNREWPCALRLQERCEFESARSISCPCQHKSVPHVFA